MLCVDSKKHMPDALISYSMHTICNMPPAQVASGGSSSSVIISRFTVDGLDPTAKLFIILHYYEIVSSLYVDMDLNKHTYILR